VRVPLDKNKIQEAAAKFVQKGQYDKAIKELQRLVEVDPKDARTLQKIGELYQKKNDDGNAASYFLQVAECYSAEGFFLKAVAVYKQVLKLDASLIDVNFKLAELYQQLGLMSDAMQQYQTVAAHYDKAGNAKASLDTLRRMVDLDPDNVASRIKLAELYARQQMNDEAIAEFRRAAEYLKRNNRVDDYLKVAERLVFLNPQDLGLAREVANIYLTKNDTKRALAKLQLCFKADPKDIETLTMLADAFKALGQTSKTISVYKELAKIYAEKGNLDEERRVWRQVLELVPDDPDALAHAEDAPVERPAPARLPTPAPAVGRHAHALPADAARPSVDHVAKLLTETDVYVKYGLHEKAVEHLRKIFAMDPDCIEAHEKAVTLYTAAGNRQAAFDELLTTIRICLKRGDPGRALPHFQKALQQNPGHPEVVSFHRALGRAADVAPAEDIEVGEDAILLEAAAENEDVPVAEEPADAMAESEDIALIASQAAEDEPVVAEDSGPVQVAEDESLIDTGAEVPAVRDDPFVDAPLVEPDAVYDEAVEVAAQPEDEVVLEEDVAPVQGTQFEEDYATVPTMIEQRPDVKALLSRPPGRTTEREAVTPPPRAPSRAIVPTPPEPKRPATEFDTAAEELDEATFLLEQNHLSEARELIETVLLAYPQHLRARKLLGQLADLEAAGAQPEDMTEGEGLGSEEATTLAGEAGDVDAAFDLARELEEELGDNAGEEGSTSLAGANDYQISAEEVVTEFKRGLQKVLKPEEADAHYDMGIAFKEMMLVDDAISEFKVAWDAVRGKKKEVDCLTMLGVCLGMKGQHSEAVHYFKEALGSPQASPEATKNLNYELGLAFEAMGDNREALAYLSKVQRVDPKYRDVAKAIARLGSRPNGSGGGHGSGGGGEPGEEESTTPNGPRVKANGVADHGDGKPAGKGSPGKSRNVGYV
jgi:pilus assembly protein FimV